VAAGKRLPLHRNAAQGEGGLRRDRRLPGRVLLSQFRIPGNQAPADHAGRTGGGLRHRFERSLRALLEDDQVPGSYHQHPEQPAAR